MHVYVYTFFCLDVRAHLLVAQCVLTAEEARLKGNDFFAKNEYALAEQAYTHAVGLDPKNPVHWVNHSAVLHELSRSAESLTAAQRALELDPKSIQGLYRVGRAQLELRKPQEALLAFDACLALNTDLPKVKHYRDIAQSQLAIVATLQKAHTRCLWNCACVNERRSNSSIVWNVGLHCAWFDVACHRAVQDRDRRQKDPVAIS